MAESIFYLLIFNYVFSLKYIVRHNIILNNVMCYFRYVLCIVWKGRKEEKCVKKKVSYNSNLDDANINQSTHTL